MSNLNHILILKERESLAEMIDKAVKEDKNITVVSELWRSSYDEYTRFLGNGQGLDNEDYYAFAMKRIQYQRFKIEQYLKGES